MKSLYDALHGEDPQVPTVDPLELVTKLTGKNFSKAVVESKQYRQSIVRRIVTDTLPSAVECKLLDHAWGVPKQRLEIEDKTVSLEDQSPEQLEARALLLAKRARQLRERTPSEDSDGAIH